MLVPEAGSAWSAVAVAARMSRAPAAPGVTTTETVLEAPTARVPMGKVRGAFVNAPATVGATDESPPGTGTVED